MGTRRAALGVSKERVETRKVAFCFDKERMGRR
jgi:hypothetical protein